MKKVIAIAFVGMFGVLTLGSCKKDWNCECSLINSSSSGSSSTTINGTKKDAKDKCDKLAYSGVSTCEIK